MSDASFENFVAELFNHLGYNSERTKLSGDQGVDVIAKKGTQVLAIQVKHYNQPVGNSAIQEVVAGANYYNATICYVVTNNYFTKSAKALANANNVILWDRDKLIEKLGEM
jgi:restriction system protein